MMIAYRLESVILVQNKSIKFTLLSLFITISTFIVFIYAVNLYMPDISAPVIALMIMGLFIGSLLPNIIATWLIIILTTIGSSFLVLGQMILPLSSKILLILILPVVAGIMIFNRNLLGLFSLNHANQEQVERYMQHYDQVTKLQGRYNAEKIYHKIVNFIKQDTDDELWVHVTALKWTHGHQFSQFHYDEYNQMIKDVAKLLKDKRLPSEALYYLGDGMFLIISYETSDHAILKRTQMTKEGLNNLTAIQATPQFQWGYLKVNHANVTKFLTFEEAVKHLERMMETDIVVEYLKGVEE